MLVAVTSVTVTFVGPAEGTGEIKCIMILGLAILQTHLRILFVDSPSS